jgi:hypothetical protein
VALPHERGARACILAIRFLWRDNAVRCVAQRTFVAEHLINCYVPVVVYQSGGAMSARKRADISTHLTEKEQEARNIRRLQMMMSMVMSVISQDVNLTVEEASELVAGTKRAALAMFPDKELAYDILYKPRLQRLMNERFRLQ